jgi:hypothetical protein
MLFIVNENSLSQLHFEGDWFTQYALPDAESHLNRASPPGTPVRFDNPPDARLGWATIEEIRRGS